MKANTHSFNVELATKIGLVDSIIISHLFYWHQINFNKGHNIIDGSVWTYNSITSFRKIFPYLTERELRLSFERLENSGFIITANYNKLKMDRTKWYSLTERGISLFIDPKVFEINDNSEDFYTGQEMQHIHHQKTQNKKPDNPDQIYESAKMQNAFYKGVQNSDHETIENEKPDNSDQICDLAKLGNAYHKMPNADHKMPERYQVINTNNKTKEKKKEDESSFSKNEFFESATQKDNSSSFKQDKPKRKRLSEEEKKRRKTIEKILDQKIIPNYPILRHGSRNNVLKKMFPLNKEEIIQSVENLERYLKTAGTYVVSLERYYGEKIFRTEWLEAHEKQNKKILDEKSNKGKILVNGFDIKKVSDYF